MTVAEMEKAISTPIMVEYPLAGKVARRALNEARRNEIYARTAVRTSAVLCMSLVRWKKDENAPVTQLGENRLTLFETTDDLIG